MPPRIIFQVSIAISVIAWAIVAWCFIWPALRDKRPAEAIKPLLMLHSFRFVGLSFLVPGVVSSDLPLAFARPAAYGDIATTLVALLAFAMLPGRLGVLLVWIFNFLGAGDLVFAIYRGNSVGLIPGQLGAAYFIPTVLVPLLLVTHVLIFALLLRKSVPAQD